MARSFNFSIIQASPDRRRGEIVNVGMAVFLDGKVDIHLPELRKISALTGHLWDGAKEAYEIAVNKCVDASAAVGAKIDVMRDLSDTFRVSDPGVLTIDDSSQYDERVESILKSLVAKPSPKKEEGQDKINSEIARILKMADVLAARGQTINDNKVVRNFEISHEKKMKADFAYKNGVYKIVSTLDLRSSASKHGKACEKGAALHFARQEFGPSTVTMAVYAVDRANEKLRASEIDIIRSFAGGAAYNWLSASDQREFRSKLY